MISFNRISMRLADILDRYNISDKFKFRPDRTIHFGINLVKDLRGDLDIFNASTIRKDTLCFIW